MDDQIWLPFGDWVQAFDGQNNDFPANDESENGDWTPSYYWCSRIVGKSNANVLWNGKWERELETHWSFEFLPEHVAREYSNGKRHFGWYNHEGMSLVVYASIIDRDWVIACISDGERPVFHANFKEKARSDERKRLLSSFTVVSDQNVVERGLLL